MRSKKFFRYTVFALIIVTIALVGCSDTDRQAERAGGGARSWEVADHSDLQVIEGTLTYGDPEWILKTESQNYILGLGNPDYIESTGLELEEDEEVTVNGYINEDEISVISLTSDGVEYAFRSEDGVPLWSGRGRAVAVDPNVYEQKRPNSEAGAGAQTEDLQERTPKEGGGPPEGRGGNNRGGNGRGSGRWNTKNEANSVRPI